MGILEEKSLWYKYKTDVWLKDTPETVVVHNIMRVLRSIHNSDFVYASTPITSGRFLYRQHLKSLEDSKEDLLENTILHNYNQGLEFVRILGDRTNLPIIFPADMVPIRQDWEQNHFQALWLSIISEKCSEVHMNQGWAYSDGASEEFTHVIQLQLGIPRHKSLLFFNTKECEENSRKRMRKIKIYDHDWYELSLEDGINSIDKSLKWINENGFSSPRIENCRNLLEWTGNMIERGFYQ